MIHRKAGPRQSECPGVGGLRPERRPANVPAPLILPRNAISTTRVVPCYDEAARLDPGAFARFLASREDARLVFVNDGSRDGTGAVLDGVHGSASDRVDVVTLDRNVGKAEAVRCGIRRALETKVDFVGYWDADLSTPLEVSTPFAEVLRSDPSLDTVMGSRVQMLGRRIERLSSRHYAGRVFATAAALALQIPVYDTQCGAKLFRASERLARVFETPFLARWAFDVEIIARFGALTARYEPTPLCEAVYEFPLTEWRHAAGSKVRATDFLRALGDLARIRRVYVRSARPS